MSKHALWPWIFVCVSTGCTLTSEGGDSLAGADADGTEDGAGGGDGAGPRDGQDQGGDGTPADGSDMAPGAQAVTLRTLNTSQYLSSRSGALRADQASAGDDETFTLRDENGGTLVFGDVVNLAAHDGRLLSAVDGGGGALALVAGEPGGAERFVLTQVVEGSSVADGARVALKASGGEYYVSALDGGGGDVQANAPWARAWETFVLGLAGGDEPPPPPPSSDAKQRVLDVLAGFSGQATLAGQHNKYNDDPGGSTAWIEEVTGKSPALWSADFSFGQNASAELRQKMVEEAKRQWARGAVVQIMYHNCAPTGDESCEWDDVGGAHPVHLSDDEWQALISDGTDLHAAWLGRLDELARYLTDLKQAGVAPLFRPLHEMNQGAFWWGGRGGADGTRRLWQLTHDYLTNEKGLDNLIWVWDVQDFSSLGDDVNAYNPGPEYFDLAALDMYEAGYVQRNYDAMLGASGGRPIAIGECQRLPTVSELSEQPAWLFFMLWPDFLEENRDVLPGLYGASNVITLDELPGWN